MKRVQESIKTFLDSFLIFSSISNITPYNMGPGKTYFFVLLCPFNIHPVAHAVF